MKEKIINILKKETKLKKEELANLIETPPTQELGDYAFPCFTLAPKFKTPPHKIAEQLARKIKSPEFEKIEVKGPYLNFFINRQELAKKTISQILKQKDKYGSGKRSNQKVMVEFSQPNTHKAFHVGHIRGTSLGESISRIIEFADGKAIRANYSGDTGMHIAKWLWNYQKYHKKEKPKDDEAWIASIYVDAVKKLEENPELQNEVDEINRKLEQGKDKNLQNLWKQTRTSSVNAWKQIYKELNTRFDKHFFESEVEKKGKQKAEELFKKGIAEISEGATIVNLEKYNLGVSVLLRKDGTVLYSAKDLSLAEEKFKDFKINKSVYVVGNAQRLYFNQLFQILKLMNFKKADSLQYIPFGEVRFPWGKMSSRTGENILYSDFKRELVDYAAGEIRKRYKLEEKEIQERALALAIAAMKYAMLKQDTNKQIIFDKKEALRFEGNTGPYLLYTYARAKSILRKAEYKPKKIEASKLNAQEKNLLFQLSIFPETVEKAYKSLAPNIIANYSYQIAQTFNEFYHANKVINSKEEQFRLALVDAFSQVLKNSLTLLGIQTLEKM